MQRDVSNDMKVAVLTVSGLYQRILNRSGNLTDTPSRVT